MSGNDKQQPTQVPMQKQRTGDEEIVREIKSHVAKLNDLIGNAADIGITVAMNDVDATTVSDLAKRVFLEIKIYKVL